MTGYKSELFTWSALASLILVLLIGTISTPPQRTVDNCTFRSWIEDAKESHDQWLIYGEIYPELGNKIVTFRDSSYTRLEWDKMWSDRYSLMLESLPDC